MTLWNQRVFPNPQISFNSKVQHTAVILFDDEKRRNHRLHKSVLNNPRQVNRSNQFKGYIFQ